MNDPVVYHQIAAKDWPSAKKHGLASASRGVKGNDKSIIRADHFLDSHLPKVLKAAGVSRTNNLYGYMGTVKTLIDIETGKPCPLSQKISEEGQVLLQVNVEPTNCWVSNLDLYDRTKRTLAAGGNAAMEALAYWSALQRLDKYDGSIPRPEVMITYDIAPDSIRRVTADDSRPLRQ